MGLASAGLVVAELGNLFTFRAQPKKRDVTVLVEEVFSREKKSTVEQSVHPKPRIAKTTKREHSKPQEQTLRENGVVKK